MDSLTLLGLLIYFLIKLKLSSIELLLYNFVKAITDPPRLHISQNLNCLIKVNLGNNHFDVKLRVF